jgi:hypothetical protein
VIVLKDLSAKEMADGATHSERLIKHIRSNIRCVSTTKAPYNGVGSRRSIAHLILWALQEHLLRKSNLYLGKMALFLEDWFKAVTIAMSISHTLKSIK